MYFRYGEIKSKFGETASIQSKYGKCIVKLDGRRIHYSLEQEIIKKALENYWIKKATNGGWLLVVNNEMYIVKYTNEYKIKPIRLDDIYMYMKGDKFKDDDLPEL